MQPAVTTSSLRLRLYAIDVRTIMVERIKVAWYHDMVLNDVTMPYLDSLQAQCLGESNPLEQDIGSVLVENGIVVASVNYVVPTTLNYGRGNRETSVNQSLMVSVTDNGDSYQTNYFNKTLAPFQTVVYASPNFTRSKCDSTVALSPPSVWVSWIVNATNSTSTNSLIQNIDIQTGNILSEIDLPGLKNITLTSRMAIFYNDQVVECKDFEGEKIATMLVPLVFGYASKGSYFIAAVDISPSPAELRWTVKTFDNAPPVGQITTVGEARDTMMVVTTTQGCFFYLLYSDATGNDI